jgi:hypothetical protein
MKKFALFFGGFLFVLLAVVIAIPYFFKDQIKAKLLEEIDSRIDADFFFKEMHVSPLRNFPHMTLDLEDFYILGKEKFQGDTLGDAKTLSVSFDFYSLIQRGHKVKIKSIHLNEPHVHILVLPDGVSNYSIFSAGNSSAAHDSSFFNIKINRWEIKNGEITYDDRQQHTFLELDGLNHSGNGDFTQNVSDLHLATSVAAVSYSLNGIRYLDRKKLSTDLKMEVNLKELKFTFKDHVFEINHFKFGFEGWFQLLKEGYAVDLRLLVNRTDFKDLLSLLPGFYVDDFKKMNVVGEFTLEGHAQGTYDFASHRVPAFSLALNVKEGGFKYNHLPKAIDHINVDLLVENATGRPNATTLDIRKFEMAMGGEPVTGRMKLVGLDTGFMDAEIKATLDLAEIEKMYPVNGLTLKGKLSADIKAKGEFNTVKFKSPLIDGQVVLDNGYVKSASYPLAMENIHINAEAVNKTGHIRDTRVDIHQLTYLLDGEPFQMKGSIHDLTNYAYDLAIDGLIDFEKLTKLYPVNGISLTGTMDVDVETSGKLSTLRAKRFDSLTSSGSIVIKNVVFTSRDLPQVLKISDAKLTFTPEELSLEKFNASLGKSNLSLKGHLFDYHSYFFDTGRNVRGDLELASDTLDLNQFLTPSTTKDSTQSGMKTAEIPKGIDFTFDANIGFIRFNQMRIEDLAGEIRIKDGVLSLRETGFTSQDAKFALNGSYDTRDMKHPAFDMVIDINKLDINKAYSMFESVQSAAPAAQNTDGVVTTKYHLKGELGPDLSPVMASLTGGGTIIIEDAEIKGMKMFNNVSAISNKKELNDPKVKNITMETEIKGGKVYIKPVSFQIGKYFTELEGSQSFDNTMDYVLKISVPSLHKLKVPFHISGTVSKPVVKLGKGHEKFDFSKF